MALISAKIENMELAKLSSSSLRFGTSGLRGLVVDLTEETCRLYARAFIAHLQSKGDNKAWRQVLLGRDLRASSPAIAESCIRGVQDAGLEVLDCGVLPTPALALAAMTVAAPAIMVTGSHIPDDRNGLKFYRSDGEIDKADERGILAALDQLPSITPKASLVEVTRSDNALRNYVERYSALAPVLSLGGMRIGIYQHSSVARDLLVEILQRLGAETVTLGHSEIFVPVDTEALEERDKNLAKIWDEQFRLDALVSTDGDADRPLISDEHGEFLRGDLVGLLTAKFLNADIVVTPVTSTSSVEEVALFREVIRTRVGSPFVIEAIADRMGKAGGIVVGFEANGGVLLGSEVTVDGIKLAALPTRDALLPILAVLSLAKRSGKTISALLAELPARFTASERLANTPAAASAALLRRLEDEIFARHFVSEIGSLERIDSIDGVQMTLNDGDSVHFRASGNAPELRCYVEAATSQRASELLMWGLKEAQASLNSAGAE